VIYIVQEKYDKNDQIYVCDFLFAEALEYAPIHFNYRTQEKRFEDSLFSIFKSKILNLPLYINFKSGSENFVDSLFLAKKYNSTRLPPPKLIIDIANNCNEEIVLVPFIFLRYNATGTEGGTWFFSQLGVILYIVNKGKITFGYRKVFQSKEKIFSIGGEPARRFDLHTEEEWQNIIKEVMQPYIDRMSD
jgi:hypothetical protein